MESKRKKIKVQVGIMTHADINYPLYEHFEIPMTTVYRHGSSLSILARLTHSQRVFMDYLTEVMDKGNLVIHNEKIRSDFIFYMEKIDCGSYSHSYLRNIFQALFGYGLLVKGEKRAYWYVNPFYFSKNAESREKLLKYLISTKKLKPI
jgi:hypothetical protein